MRVLHIALGGCLTAPPVRYGLTADTGGHIGFVLGAALASAAQPGVAAVDIATRRFDDPRLGAAHAMAEEALGPGVRILRIDDGDPRYLEKEALDARLEAFTRALTARLSAEGAQPDIVHAHFADAAEVARRLRAAIGAPFLYTPHSLSRDKIDATGAPVRGTAARAAAELRALGEADGVIVSSRDEAERQLGLYGFAGAAHVLRAAPGVEAAPAAAPDDPARLEALLGGAIARSSRPMALAVARPAPRKNLEGLVRLFAADARLRARADLVILAGVEGRLNDEQTATRRAVARAMAEAGPGLRCALPARHERADVFALYALAARRGGVFVNPAFSEPYGLTTLEAAGAGLPVVATDVGGAAETVRRLGCGGVASPTEPARFAAEIRRLIDDRAAWEACAEAGRRGAASRDWTGWARRVVKRARGIAGAGRPARLLVCDLDGTLTGDRAAARRFFDWRMAARDHAFAIATGRALAGALETLWDWGLPTPDILIAGCGAEIWRRDGETGWALDDGWSDHIAQGWDANAVSRALDGFPGLAPQPAGEQRRFKRSYFADAVAARRAKRRLVEADAPARVVHSHGDMLDIVPPRAGKGAAARWCAAALRLPLAALTGAGNSGNDRCLIAASGRGVIVANRDGDLAPLRFLPNVHAAMRPYADGVLEALGALDMRDAA